MDSCCLLNAKLLTSAIAHVRRITYRMQALILAFDIAASPQHA